MTRWDVKIRDLAFLAVYFHRMPEVSQRKQRTRDSLVGLGIGSSRDRGGLFFGVWLVAVNPGRTRDVLGSYDVWALRS